jgi:hypothetical protein
VSGTGIISVAGENGNNGGNGAIGWWVKMNSTHGVSTNAATTWNGGAAGGGGAGGSTGKLWLYHKGSFGGVTVNNSVGTKGNGGIGSNNGASPLYGGQNGYDGTDGTNSNGASTIVQL